ncbi:hypothetical protein CB1_011054016 [Camelus ferus]|nr:hypothetical protein CB1_011054016 [Camelus ferus]
MRVPRGRCRKSPLTRDPSPALPLAQSYHCSSQSLLDTDVNKSASLTPEEQPDEPDGPLPGSASDQEKKASTFRYSR